MKPVVQDLDIYRGDTHDFFFRVRNRVYDAATQTYVAGTYVDLTGWTGKSQIRENEAASTVLAEFTVTFSNQATTPGGVLLSLTPAQTVALPVSVVNPAGILQPIGRWDVELVNGTGTKRTFIRGSVFVTAEVTRP